ncbi:hypothetical protein G6L37_05090 [Agrobacterium rubi]|nr:hypothetical protein [Agrobacterium rubi]NTF24731.1 hypothetical protein [Agrobacterium rubi]
MISELFGSVYTVTVTSADVNTFAASFPCHGLDLDAEYVFEFDVRNGDLVAMSALRDGVKLDDVGEDEDGEGLRVLTEDAGLTGAEHLGLRDVLLIRFGQEAAYA